MGTDALFRAPGDTDWTSSASRVSSNIPRSMMLLGCQQIQTPVSSEILILKCMSNMASLTGSRVLKASVGRVSVDTIGQYGDRHSADISTDTRSICRPRLGRVSVDMLF